LRHTVHQQQLIVVEVKCFAEKSLMDTFQHAIGQYVIYRQAMIANDYQHDLYLTVPLHIYTTFFHIKLIKDVIQLLNMRIIVVDLATEEIVQWI
jgi:hypothetical protein